MDINDAIREVTPFVQHEVLAIGIAAPGPAADTARQSRANRPRDLLGDETQS